MRHIDELKIRLYAEIHTLGEDATDQELEIAYVMLKDGAVQKVFSDTESIEKERYITVNNSPMQCNNCGAQMMRSCVNYHVTVCNECGMRHRWPNDTDQPRA